jgi:phosphopentomutase
LAGKDLLTGESIGGVGVAATFIGTLAGSGKAAREAAELAAAAINRIPGNPFTGINAPSKAYDHLQKHSGLDPNVASARLHRLKQAGGMGGADDVAIGRTGDVYNARTGEHLGSLTDKSLGGR